MDRLPEMTAYDAYEHDDPRERRHVWLGAIALCLAFWVVVWVLMGVVG